MGNKRHTHVPAVRLLARLLTAVEAPSVAPVKCRLLLAELLRARFGDVVVREKAVAAVEELSDGQIDHQRLILRDAMRSAVRFKEDDLTVALPGVSVTGAAYSNNYVLELAGRVDGLLWVQLVYLLRASGDNLRACAAEEDCGRLFIRRGRRKFCSERCQKRIYMREQRAKERRAYGKATRTR